MEAFKKQSIGIDISKDTFTACLCMVDENGNLIFSKVSDFENRKHGFNQFVKWVRKQAEPKIPTTFLMEATGIYYESLAYHLHNLKQNVSVILPNKVKHYAKSLNIKSKTDSIDARIIAQLGAERKVELWEPPAVIFKELRVLTRLCSDLKKSRTVFTNRLDSTNSGYEPLDFVVKTQKAILQKLDKEIAKCELEIEKLLKREDWLWKKVEKILTIKGVGLTSLAIVLGETQGFKLIKNIRQLVSYAGYDIVQRESGTTIKGKTKISKKGNSRIRGAMYFPAISASQYNPHLRAVYERINKNKPNKMSGNAALQRKLLVLIYSLWKNDTTYRSEEKEITSGEQEAKLLLRQKDEVFEKKVDRSTDLPTQDEHPSEQSAEALLRQEQST